MLIITNMTVMAVMVIMPEMHVMAVLALMKAMSVMPINTVMAATSLKFSYIAWTCNLVESDVLETYLFDSFLEVLIIQHFEGISVDKKFLIAFDFSVT